MRDAIWAAECLRFYTFVVLAIFGSRFLLWAADETPTRHSRAGVFAWLLRGFVVWGLATVLGYL